MTTKAAGHLLCIYASEVSCLFLHNDFSLFCSKSQAQLSVHLQSICFKHFYMFFDNLRPLRAKKATSKSRHVAWESKKASNGAKQLHWESNPEMGLDNSFRRQTNPAMGQYNSFWRWTNPATRQYNSFGRQTNPAMGRDNSFGRQTHPAMGWYNSFGNQTNPAVGNKIYLICHTLWILPKLTVEHQIICANNVNNCAFQ